MIHSASALQIPTQNTFFITFPELGAYQARALDHLGCHSLAMIVAMAFLAESVRAFLFRAALTRRASRLRRLHEQALYLTHTSYSYIFPLCHLVTDLKTLQASNLSSVHPTLPSSPRIHLNGIWKKCHSSHCF